MDASAAMDFFEKKGMDGRRKNNKRYKNIKGHRGRNPWHQVQSIVRQNATKKGG